MGGGGGTILGLRGLGLATLGGLALVMMAVWFAFAGVRLQGFALGRGGLTSIRVGCCELGADNAFPLAEGMQ